MSAKYWNKTGKYSQLLDEKWDELVPDLGESETEIGDDWREMAFDCLPMSVSRYFDFVKFV